MPRLAGRILTIVPSGTEKGVCASRRSRGGIPLPPVPTPDHRRMVMAREGRAPYPRDPIHTRGLPMLVNGDPEGQDLEDTLRSLGAVLDFHMARAILIKEVEAGLIVRARISPTLEHRLDGASVSLERVFGEEELREQRRAAVARRGTGHVAGPLERSLRTIGRMADEGGLTGLMLIQHDSEGAWLLWYDGMPGGSPRLLAFTHGELEQLDVAVMPQREAAELPEDGATPEMAAVAVHPTYS